jgi:acyl carrier protein
LIGEMHEIIQTRGQTKLMTHDQFLELLTDWIRSNKQIPENMLISADTELLGSGLLDSFDFLDLIMHLESKTGRKIDLAVADPSEFSVVGGLCNLALGSAWQGSGQPESGRGNTVTADAGV